MGTGKKKIEIKKKEKDSDRMVTFSKRRQGLFKKARELHLRTGANVAILVFSEAGRVYTHGDPSFEATIDKYLTTHQEIHDDHVPTRWVYSHGDPFSETTMVKYLTTHQEIIHDDHVPTGQVYTHGDLSSEATTDKYLTTNQESHGDCETNSLRTWLDSIQAEAYNDMDQLLQLKMGLEEIKEKLVQRIGDEFVHSLLV
ncbi:unnamed protein product [Ilex paraguariensis]|uniref:MADS-box domain-containing protein n=1 Tax=Ilex paraguariensis TaxID=185542 RepID=A0ABC8S9J7_9AQUA